MKWRFGNTPWVLVWDPAFLFQLLQPSSAFFIQLWLTQKWSKTCCPSQVHGGPCEQVRHGDACRHDELLGLSMGCPFLGCCWVGFSLNPQKARLLAEESTATNILWRERFGGQAELTMMVPYLGIACFWCWTFCGRCHLEPLGAYRRYIYIYVYIYMYIYI